MDAIHVGPTIFAVIAWGCSLNLITAAAVAQKEGWGVPEIVYNPRFGRLGKIGMFVSMFLAYLASGWWGLLIVPAGGMLFGGVSTAILRETMMAISAPIGVVASLVCGIWLFVII